MKLTYVCACYINMYTCICKSVSTHTYMCVCVCVCVYTHICLRLLYQYIYMHYTKTIVHTQQASICSTYSYTHTHTHKHPAGFARFQKQKEASVQGFCWVSPDIVRMLVNKSGLEILKESQSVPQSENLYYMRDYICLVQKI